MKFSRLRLVAFVFLGAALVAAVLCLALPTELVAPVLEVAMAVGIVGAVLIAFADLRAESPPTDGLTREQQEGRRELRALRRQRYLAARFGTDADGEQSIHRAFNADDAARRRQRVDDGAKRLAEAEAELFRRGEEQRRRRAELGAVEVAPAELSVKRDPPS